MAATLKYWVVLCYIVPLLVGLILYQCYGNKMRDLTEMFAFHPLGQKLACAPSFTKKKMLENCLFCNVVWFLISSIFLIAIIILANCSPDTFLLSHSLSSIAIVKNIYLLNTILSVVMVSGVISNGLIYQEYDKARTSAEEMGRRSNLEE